MEGRESRTMGAGRGVVSAAIWTGSGAAVVVVELGIGEVDRGASALVGATSASRLAGSAAVGGGGGDWNIERSGTSAARGSRILIRLALVLNSGCGLCISPLSGIATTSCNMALAKLGLEIILSFVLLLPSSLIGSNAGAFPNPNPTPPSSSSPLAVPGLDSLVFLLLTIGLPGPPATKHPSLFPTQRSKSIWSPLHLPSLVFSSAHSTAPLRMGFRAEAEMLVAPQIKCPLWLPRWALRSRVEGWWEECERGRQ